MIRTGKYENASDSFRSDQWVLDMFPGAFDPCPYNPDWSPEHYDGLVDDWKLPPIGDQLVYINPPYSNVMPWVERALEEITHARLCEQKMTIVMLLKHDSSTKWYAKLHSAGAKFLMFQGRLKHQTKQHCSFPSVLAVLN
jgi:hypothetical protein